MNRTVCIEMKLKPVVLSDCERYFLKCLIFKASHSYFHGVFLWLHVSVQLTWQWVNTDGEARMRLTEHHQRCSRKSAGLSVKHSHQGAPPVRSLTGRGRHVDEANTNPPSLHCLPRGGDMNYSLTHTQIHICIFLQEETVTCVTR